MMLNAEKIWDKNIKKDLPIILIGYQNLTSKIKKFINTHKIIKINSI